MKKKIIIGVCCAVILLLVILMVSGAFSKKKNLEDEYLKILDNRSFVLDGKTKRMKDLVKENDRIDFYSFVDYGNDSHLEMFVRVTGTNSNCYVFNLVGNKMYAYALDEDIVSNSSNGYSSFIGLTMGWVKYTFNKKKVNKEVIITENLDTSECSYKGESVDCKDIQDLEIEFLNSIGAIADINRYGESVDNLA